MSMLQIEPYINPCPLATSMTGPQAPWVYYFLYAYDECDNFPKVCSGAQKVGFATLQDWVWHINVKGKPNVRKMFYNGNDPYQTGVRSVTVGWVYRVDKADDERMHAKYGVDRVRMGQCVAITHPTYPGNVCKLPVILYWDPRNTCDSESWSCSGENQIKWEKALAALKEAGVQQWYIDHVRDTVNQRKTVDLVDDKTIYLNPQDLSYTPPVNYRTPAPLRMYTAQTPQALRHRAEHGVARLQAPPNHSTPRPQATPNQSTPRPRPTAHPQSNLRPQSANLRALAPPTIQRAATPNQISLSTNTMPAKKRKLDASDNGGQPLKKQMQKKPPPGPSSLRHGTPAA
ncbi:hypothetical protein N431DRAFT_399630 [Stipitochalara longipes BDJ]|nr:hypothetical protein N431DRAFT_399630 [Stipitochalara longipes BDJ]